MARRGSDFNAKRMGVVHLIKECMLMMETVDLRSIPDQAAAAYCENFVVSAQLTARVNEVSKRESV